MTLPVHPNKLTLGHISAEFGPLNVYDGSAVYIRAGNIVIDTSRSLGSEVFIRSVYGSVTFSEGVVLTSSSSVNIRAATQIEIYQIVASANVRLCSDAGGANSVKKIKGSPPSSAGAWYQNGYGDVVAVNGTVITLINTPIVRIGSGYGTFPVSNTPVSATSPTAGFVIDEIPDGFNSVDVALVGGGGGGGSGTASEDEGYAGSGGGGAGGRVTFTGLSVIAGRQYSFAVGAGGAGRAGNNSTENRTGTFNSSNSFSKTSGTAGGFSGFLYETVAAYAYGGEGSRGIYWKYMGLAPVAPGGTGLLTNITGVITQGGSGGAMTTDDNTLSGAGGTSFFGAGGAGGLNVFFGRTSGANGVNAGSGGGGGGGGRDDYGVGAGGNGANGRADATWTTPAGTVNYRNGGNAYDALIALGTHNVGTVGDISSIFNAYAVSGQLNLGNYFANAPIGYVTAGQIGFPGGVSTPVPTWNTPKPAIKISNFHGATYLPPVVLALTNNNVTNGSAPIGSASGSARAGIEFRSDGTLQLYYQNTDSGFSSTTYSPVSGQWRVSGTSECEIRVTLISGVAPTVGPALNTWLSLSSTRLWYLQGETVDSVNFVDDQVSTVEVTIRRLGFTTPSVTAQFTLQVSSEWTPDIDGPPL